MVKNVYKKKTECGHKYLKLLLESYPAPPVGHFKSEGRKCFETGGRQNIGKLNIWEDCAARDSIAWVKCFTIVLFSLSRLSWCSMERLENMIRFPGDGIGAYAANPREPIWKTINYPHGIEHLKLSLLVMNLKQHCHKIKLLALCAI